MRYDYENKLIIIEKNDSVREIVLGKVSDFPDFIFVIERENGELDDYISVFDELRGYCVKNNAKFSFDNLQESEKMVVYGMCRTLDIFRDFYKSTEKDTFQKNGESLEMLVKLEADIWIAIDQFIISCLC